MTTIKHRIPNKNVRKRIYQIYIYIICFIQGKENFQSDYFTIISRCERKKYLLPCQNMLIKSNSTRAKRRGKKIYGKSPSMSTISDPKRIAHIILEPGVEDARVSWLWHTWPCIEYQGTLRSPALLLLLSKTMFECRSCVIHAARPVSPIPFPDICNPVHIYIYIYMYRWPMFSRQQATIPHLPFPSDETSIRVHCLVLDLRFLCNLCCENLSIVIWNLLFDHSFGSKEG